jgi:predicted MFS family arabinose efflux permease
MKKYLKRYLDNFKNFPKEIWILAFITFLNRAGTMVIPFLSKYLKEHLYLSYGQIGSVLFFFGMGSLVGTWLSAILSDKFGYYKVMALSLFGTGIVFFLLQRIDTFEGLCIGVFILTTIADTFRPAMLVSLSSYTKNENSTRAFTLVRSATNLGFLFGPVLGGLIIISSGYSYLFFIDGGTCILAGLVFCTQIKEIKLPFKLKNHNLLNEKNAIIKDKLFLFHLVATAITGILYFQFFTVLPIYHREKFNLSEFDSGLILSMSGLLVLLCELPVVNYIEKNKINKLNVILYGVLFMVLGFLLLIHNSWSGILIVVSLFITIGAMLTFPFAKAFAMRRSHKNKEAKYMALFTMSYSVAHILSAKTSMEIISRYNYDANWELMSALGVFAAILILMMRRWAKQEEIQIQDKIVQSIFVNKHTVAS